MVEACSETSLTNDDSVSWYSVTSVMGIRWYLDYRFITGGIVSLRHLELGYNGLDLFSINSRLRNMMKNDTGYQHKIAHLIIELMRPNRHIFLHPPP